MSKRRLPQTESSGYRLLIDPGNMVVLRAANGEVFLVERNCAMVSKRFRDILSEMEAIIPSSLTQEETRESMDHMHGGSHTGEAVSGGSSASSPTHLERVRKRSVGDERHTLLPFYDMEWELRPHLSDRGKALFSVGQVLYSRHRQSFEAGAYGSGELSPGLLGTIGSERSTGSVVPGGLGNASFTSPMVPTSASGSSKNGPRGTMMLSSPSGPKRSPVSCLEDEHGIRWYPLFDFPDISSYLLEVGIRYMYLKYRMDSEPEKRIPFHPSLINEGGSTVCLIAASAILGM